MTSKNQDLATAARQAQLQSYSPYSKFKVGAAILADNEQTYSGCNVENASYPLGQCAEASAISAMIIGGGRKIRDVMIMSPTDEFCPPCGGCRQKIGEFATKETMVHMACHSGKIKSVPFSTLLPLAFELE